MEVAEEKGAAAAATSAAATAAPLGGAGGGKNNIILIALAIVNMLVVGGVGFMLFQGRKKEAAEPKIEQVIKGEKEAQEHDKENTDEKKFVGQIIPLEKFIINLAGSKGRKLASVSIELEVKGSAVQEEIDKRKAQIRDIIIIILSSKTYEEVSSREGKDNLRNEVKDTINSFLVKGKISNVFFTEFIYN
ncbi:MAG TPA: flagellar basal body-associated FliL family protein [Pseudobdellovibrionaceae bacterium]|jgi:flagellar FliL protein